MSLTTGTKLGPYEIVAAIGAGGMGEVYRACDTRLNRDVAIKVLPESFAADADRRARFEREAGLLPGDRVVAWTRDSKALLVQTADVPAQLDRLEPAAGARAPVVKGVGPPDLVGVLKLVMTSVLDDGRAYAYEYRRTVSTLFAATGCRWETMSAPCR